MKNSKLFIQFRIRQYIIVEHTDQVYAVSTLILQDRIFLVFIIS